MSETIQVVAGRPDDAELAAVVTVLVACDGDSRAEGTGAAGPPRRWGAPGTLLRRSALDGGWGGLPTGSRT